MLMCLTKTNSTPENDKEVFVNFHSIAYFTKFSKDEAQGSELYMTNGTILHVKQTPQEIYKMRYPWKEAKDALAAQK